MFHRKTNRWRAYVRDPRAPSPRTLDTAILLCEGHGLLLTPPHVEEFLSGERRALLGGLDPDRSGCVCEILTPEEWDALTLVRDPAKQRFAFSEVSYLVHVAFHGFSGEKPVDPPRHTLCSCCHMSVGTRNQPEV